MNKQTREFPTIDRMEIKLTSIPREIFSWVGIIAVAFVLAFAINHFIIVNAKVPTGSMMDTIPEKSRVVAFRLSYLFSEPQRFDVIVFRYPDDEKQLFVKRIIGMPGDVVNVVDGKVYINDSVTPLDDVFVRGVPKKGNESYTPEPVPENSYFVLGDNRDNSLDSRLWTNHYVSKDQILGKAQFCYYPVIKLIR